jgi:hypothetical protein
MEHVVFYPGADGAPAFHRANSLQDAIGYVEQLRNSQDITEFSVHALTQVPVSLRAYYHVEVPGTDEQTATEAIIDDAVVDDAPAEVDAVSWSHDDEPSDDDVPPAHVDGVGEAVQFALGDLATEPDLETTSVAPEPVVIRPVAVEPVELIEQIALVEQIAPVEPIQQVEQVEQFDHIAPQPGVSSEILSAAAAEVASFAPADADAVAELAEADDRSEEWVAAATVMEPPALAPAVAPVPDPTPVAVFDSFLAAVEPSEPATEPRPTVEPEFAPLAVAPPVEGPLPPSLQLTPFAVAPPVGAPSMAFVHDVEPASYDAPVETTEELAPDSAEFSGDILPPAEAGSASRRSLGFFAR